MSLSRSEKFFLFLVLIIATIRVFETTLPHPHGDALYYHLVGPKYFLEDGFSKTTSSFIPFLQAGYFDYLYLIPTLIFKSPFYIQIVSQFMHFASWFCLIALVCLQSFRHSKIYGLLGITFFLTIAKSADFLLYAKNDGTMAAMGLIAAVLINKEKILSRVDERLKLIFLGLALGLIPAIKINGLILSAILGITFAIKSRKKPLQVILVGGIAILTLAPILIRNYIYSGNPVFPGFTTLFPGSLPESTLVEFRRLLGSPLSLDIFNEQLKALFMGKAIFLSIPIFMILNRKNNTSKESFLYLLSGIIYFICYLMVNGGIVYERMLFPSYFLFIFYILKSLKSIDSDKLVFFFLVFALVDSKVDKGVKRVSEHYKITSSMKTEREMINHSIPLTKIWNFVDENSLVLSDQWSQVFYAPKGVRLQQLTAHRGAEFFYHCKNTDEMKKYKYAIIAKNKSTPCYQYIFENGKLLTSINNYKLYQLKDYE